uniref:Uncharacterized protein n=1 Tax=Anguilla anguilla TaxID=7936 RepID=A0A0E9S9T9_ANGAN
MDLGYILALGPADDIYLTLLVR